MLQYYYGTGTAKQSCGYFARKVHGSKKANQRECIVLCLLSIVLFCLNSRRHSQDCSRRPASSHKTCHTPPPIGWFSSQCLTHVSSHRLSVNVCFSHVWAVVTLWPFDSFFWPVFHCNSVSRLVRWRKQASCPLLLLCHPSCPLHLTSPMPRQLRQPGGGRSVWKWSRK